MKQTSSALEMSLPRDEEEGNVSSNHHKTSLDEQPANALAFKSVYLISKDFTYFNHVDAALWHYEHLMHPIQVLEKDESFGMRAVLKDKGVVHVRR